MKNHELLDMIGEANEDYVQAADENVVHPRFRWKTLAACAACAALVLGGAYPAYLAAKPGGAPPLHDYTVMEGGGGLTTNYEESKETIKAPAGGGDAAVDAGEEAATEVNGFTGSYEAGRAPAYSEEGEDDLSRDGFEYSVPGQRELTGDIPVQEAALWYDALLRTYRLEEYPEWYGGAWIAEDRLLAVAIVDGFRTPELEAQLQEAAGEGAVLQFSTVKYSLEFLNGLMEPATRALGGSNLSAGLGVDVMANCLGVDLYSNGAVIPDEILARLAHLDPDGDAIRVRVFTGKLSAFDETIMKGPAPDAISTPVTKDEREHPAEEPGAVPGGATQPAVTVDEFPQAKETSAPAEHDIIYGGAR